MSHSGPIYQLRRTVISRFARNFGSALIVIWLVGCAAPKRDAGVLPPGPTVVSPNNVVVFGKINLSSDVREIDETAGVFILQPLAANWRPWQLDLAQVKIPFKSGEEFYVVIPREEELVLLETVEQSDYGTILCRNIGFRVPADATAVYVGTFSFEEKKGTSPYSWDKDNFSVVDDYEQAVVQLHRRHSGLGGRITKSVLRYEPNLYHDGFFSNLPSRCWIQLPPPVYFFPFLPVMP